MKPQPMDATRFDNFFHCNSENIGDWISGPAQHLWSTEEYRAINLAFGKRVEDIFGDV